jgi:homoserine O-acetyltransferase
VGANVSFTEITSDKGHDSFLLELPEFDDAMRGFLNGSAALYGIN